MNILNARLHFIFAMIYNLMQRKSCSFCLELYYYILMTEDKKYHMLSDERVPLFSNQSFIVCKVTWTLFQLVEHLNHCIKS